jgi:hypothetical protein
VEYVTVEADGPYMTLFDLKSPVNVAGHHKLAWDKAWDFPSASPGAFKGAWSDGELDQATTRFEKYWEDLQRQGQLLLWIVPGAVRVRLRVEPHAARLGSPLDCPSGELALAPLKAVGDPLRAAFTVPPGKYRATWDTLTQGSGTIVLNPAR